MAKAFKRGRLVDIRQRDPLLDTRLLPEALRTSSDAIDKGVAFARDAVRPYHRSVTVKEGGITKTYAVRRRGCGIVEIGDERFWFYDFGVNDYWRDYEVLVRAPIDRATLTPLFSPGRRLSVRVDSACTTGQIFHDESCECKQQLHKAIGLLSQAGEGLIIRIPRQDGRGMGLPFKLSTLTLQYLFGTKTFNTVKAAEAISGGGQIDRRTYGGAIAVMKFLKISPRQPIALVTQNDFKTNVFLENGYAVEHLSARVAETEKTRDNMDAKRARLGHRA
jgi:GTP cyclohydrolase II